MRGLVANWPAPWTHTIEPGADVDPGTPGDGWPVSIAAATGATRYTARVIEGVDPTAVSPWWLRKRLLVAGIRPISAVVDVTNYVMIELGQPLHAFDADRVRGTVAVRNAEAGRSC